MSAPRVSERIGVPANRITEIIRSRRDVTADAALRLAEFFDTTPEFWMKLQTAHDFSKAQAERQNKSIGSIAVMKQSSKKSQPGQRSTKG